MDDTGTRHTDILFLPLILCVCVTETQILRVKMLLLVQVDAFLRRADKHGNLGNTVSSLGPHNY
jgi:hypothetical protein